MKQISVLLMLCGALVFTGCQQEGKNNSDEINPTGSVGPARIPPQNNMTNALMEGYWVFEHFVVPDDPDGTKFNKGRWYNLHADGTYDGGHWQEKTDYGNWYYRVTTEQTFLLIDSEVNDMNDAEWEIQGSTIDYSAMSWVRTGNFGDQRKILSKVLQLSAPPTKESLAAQN